MEALGILESSESNPDVTEWDDPATAQKKMQKKAERALGR